MHHQLHKSAPRCVNSRGHDTKGLALVPRKNTTARGIPPRVRNAKDCCRRALGFLPAAGTSEAGMTLALTEIDKASGYLRSELTLMKNERVGS